ncbi:MAG: metallophosphoesterase [Opitutaceae bacterium]|nr:metallophosphoesterase [Opitutaceae bacterium]
MSTSKLQFNRFSTGALGVVLSVTLACLASTQGLAQVAPPDGSVRFLAFGDWGRDGKEFQLSVAEQMGKAATENHAQFVIVLGDNFYNDGVESVESRQWTTSFEEIYTAPSLQVPWYVALGNHDYHRNPEAQVAYTLFSPRWKMPARYYSVIRRIDTTTTVQFFVIDSTPYTVSKQSPEESKFSDAARQDTSVQTAWLERALKASTAQWKIVCAHHPIYSSSRHGDTAPLVRTIEPLLEQYGVQVYLNGHEHDMQHLKVGMIHYFTSGAGSKTRPTSSDARTVFSLGDTGGFLNVRITPDVFEGQFIDYTGKVVHKAVIPRTPLTGNSK